MTYPAVALRDLVVPRPGTRNPSSSGAASFVYVDLDAVDRDTKTITTAKRTCGTDAPSRARKIIRARDVIVGLVRPNLNAVAIVPTKLDDQIASTGFCVLRTTDRLLPEYLYFFVRSKHFVDRLCGLVSGAMYPAVTERQVLEQFIPLPPIDAQDRIVDLLSQAENIVRMRREAERKAKEIVPALFLDMFGDPVTNPKGWPIATFGDLIANGPQNGLYKPSDAYGSGTPILRIDGFYDGRVKPMTAWRRLRLERSEAERFRLSEGDIVINRVNSPEYLGKSALIPHLDEPAVFESNMMRASVNAERVLPEFIIAFLQTSFARSALIKNAKHAINQSSINQGDVNVVPVYVPPIPAQVAFRSSGAQGLSLGMQQVRATAQADEIFQSLLAGMFGAVG